MDAIGLSILTGIAPFRDKLAASVAMRFERIQHRLVERTYDNTEFGYVYDSTRCLPDNLAWRMRQNEWKSLFLPPCFVHSRDRTIRNRIKWALSEWTLPLRIRLGRCDKQIEATWHEAAAAAHWYRYQKEWD